MLWRNKCRLHLRTVGRKRRRILRSDALNRLWLVDLFIAAHRERLRAAAASSRSRITRKPSRRSAAASSFGERRWNRGSAGAEKAVAPKASIAEPKPEAKGASTLKRRPVSGSVMKIDLNLRCLETRCNNAQFVRGFYAATNESSSRASAVCPTQAQCCGVMCYVPTMAGYAVTKDARRATRIVGIHTLAWLKHVGNRRARRVRRVHARRLLIDVDAVERSSRLVTGWDVA